MDVVKNRRRAVVDQGACVACGCCVKSCPLQAIEIVRGVMAQVNGEVCVGCGRCVEKCPAALNIVKVIKAFQKQGGEQ